MSDSESRKQADAVYYSILSEIDSLPIREQLRIALSWTQYVLANQVTKNDHVNMNDLQEACYEFAYRVIRIPDFHMEKHRERNAHEPCGKCIACITAGIKPPTKDILQ